jgi:hypothetical protein
LVWDDSFLKWLEGRNVGRMTHGRWERFLDDEVSPVIPNYLESADFGEKACVVRYTGDGVWVEF